MALPAGFTLEQILALPEVAEAVEKARNGAHEVCGLWLNDRGYMAGSSGKLRYWVFKNDRKPEGSSQPDYRLCVSRQLPKDHEGSSQNSFSPNKRAGGDPRQTAPRQAPQQQQPQQGYQQPHKPAPYNGNDGRDERGEQQGGYSMF